MGVGGGKLLPLGPDINVLILSNWGLWTSGDTLLKSDSQGPKSSMTILELGAFIRWPSRSALYQFQRHKLLCCCERLQSEVTFVAVTSTSHVSIFTLGS